MQYTLFRVFISTAEEVGFNQETARKLLNEMIDRLDDAIENVTSQLSDEFPDSIAKSIFDGMRKQREKHLQMRQ